MPTVEKNKNKGATWSIAEVWNRAFEDREERPVEKRDHIWASELGKAHIDTYLKMNGVKPTNPPNKRSLRKFEAGNVIEGVVQLVLMRAGIFKSAQDYVVHQYDGLCKVTGKLDILAGGVPSVERAEQAIQELNIEELFGPGLAKATKEVVAYLADKYPNGLAESVIEVKSSSSFMYDVREQRGADYHHKLQNFHYLKGKNLKYGHLLYVSKDDLRLLDFNILNPSPTEDDYRKEIEAITGYHRRQERPPLEPEIIFDHELVKFSKNWNVEYSNYLTMLYGYDEPADYDSAVKSSISRWNRVLTRIKDGKDMTDNNLKALEEMKDAAPESFKLINKLREGVTT